MNPVNSASSASYPLATRLQASAREMAALLHDALLQLTP